MLLLFLGYFLFLAGFSLFMHFESRKSEDNQYRIKLLPPPANWRPGQAAPETKASLHDPAMGMKAERALEPGLSSLP